MTHAAQQASSTQSEPFARVAVPWRWRVDAAGSSVTVSTRGFWGLARTTVALRGQLSLRDQVAGLELPVELAEGPGDRLALTANAVLEREPLGLGRSPLGMIRGPAEVRVDLMLSRSDRGSESPNSADDSPRSRHPDSPAQADRGKNVVEIPRVGM